MATRDVASTARNSSTLKGLARVGFAVDGVLNILIGVLALTTAFGSGESADQQGALQKIAQQPFGILLIWIIAVGLAGLAVFNLVSAIVVRGSGKDEWMTRAKAAGKAVVYAALTVVAIRTALGAGSSGGGPDSLSATLLSNPVGVVLLVLVGLGVLAVGAYQVVKGARQKFFDDLTAPPAGIRTAVTVAGTAGYIAKGVAIATIGVLFIVAAVTHDPSNSAGLDGALQTLSTLPLGVVVLCLVALGFVLFGVYCFVRARFAKL